MSDSLSQQLREQAQAIRRKADRHASALERAADELEADEAAAPRRPRRAQAAKKKTTRAATTGRVSTARRQAAPASGRYMDEETRSKALQMLKAGTAPKAVAEAVGKTTAAIYALRAKAKRSA